jgi:steroid delta-isomerase-like uncharacterized protein
MSLKKVMDSYLAAWNSRDVEMILSYFADDCVYEDLAAGVVLHGKAEVKAFANESFVAFPDLKFEIKSFFVTPLARLGFGKIGSEWVMSGTHKGDLRHGDLPTLPATGKSWSVRGASITEMSKGKIKRNSDYYNRP